MLLAWKTHLSATIDEGIPTQEVDYDDITTSRAYADGCGLHVEVSTEYFVTGISVDSDATTAEAQVTGNFRVTYIRTDLS